MTPYEWKETDSAYLALARPEEMFVKGSIFESERHEYEFILSGILKGTDDEYTYAFGYDKEVFDKKTAEKYNSWASDIFSWNPEEEVKEKGKYQERKAA